MYTLSGLFDNDKPIKDYTDEELHALLYGADVKVSGGGFGSKYEGLVERFTRMYIKKDAAAMSPRNRAVFEQFTTAQTCPECHGARLNQAALNCRIGGRNIAELSDLDATELIKFLEDVTDPVAVKLAARLTERVQHLVDIGLGYLSLSRETSTLSGGESQRVKMIRHLGNSLTEMLYILDEPTVGLHARDVDRLNALLKKLRDKGNTVLVVEHDPAVMAIADHVVDIGPKAGTHGGEVVFEGSYDALKNADTLTGRFLAQHHREEGQGRAASHERRGAGVPEIGPATQHCVGRRRAAPEARHRTAQTGQRLRDGRTHHRATPLRHRPVDGHH